MDNIEFTISRKKLKEALDILEPFIHKPAIYNDPANDGIEEEDYSDYHPYPKDTLFFYLNRNELKIHAIDSVDIEYTIACQKYYHECSFTLPFFYLKENIDKHKCEAYRFSEVRFFGFEVFDYYGNDGHLFNIVAFKSNKDVIYLSKIKDIELYNTTSLESDILLSTLSSFSKVPQENWSHIWFEISNNECNAFSYGKNALMYNRFHTDVEGEFAISLPLKAAKRVYDILKPWHEQTSFCIHFNNVAYRLNNFSKKININWSVIDYDRPNLNEILRDRIQREFRVKAMELKSAVRRVMAMAKAWKAMAIVHINSHYFNIYYRDIDFDISAYNFTDIGSYIGDYSFTLNLNVLNILFDEIVTDKVKVIKTRNLLYILNEGETFESDSFRAVRIGELSETDKETLYLGDKALSRHPNYIGSVIFKI